MSFLAVRPERRRRLLRRRAHGLRLRGAARRQLGQHGRPVPVRGLRPAPALPHPRYHRALHRVRGPARSERERDPERVPGAALQRARRLELDDRRRAARPAEPAGGLYRRRGPAGRPGPATGGGAGQGTASVIRSEGRCIENAGTPCTASADCGASESCDTDAGTCIVDHGTCVLGENGGLCLPGTNAFCQRRRRHGHRVRHGRRRPDRPARQLPERPEPGPGGLRPGRRRATTATSRPAATAHSTLEPGTGAPLEECDDGNLADGDGCTSLCREEIVACDVNGDARIDQLDVNAVVRGARARRRASSTRATRTRTARSRRATRVRARRAVPRATAQWLRRRRRAAGSSASRRSRRSRSHAVS